MTRHLRLAFFAALVAFWFSSAHAQGTSGAQGPVTPAVTAVPNMAVATDGPANTIRLNVEVAPKGGGPVAGLTQADFTLLDNGTARQITGFRALSTAQEAVQVILVFDAVNARFSTVAYERNQVEKYLRSKGSGLPVPFSVSYLTDKGVQMQQGASRDGAALAQALESNAPGLREINRSAGFWGADERLQLSLQGIERVIDYAARQPGRKLVMWISPGWPLLSGPRMDLDARQQEQIYSAIVAYSTAMRQGNMTLYSLDPIGPGESLMREDYYQGFLRGISKPSQTDLADLSVQVLALHSGGETVNSSDIGRTIQRWLDDAEFSYELTFDAPPAEHPNEYHHVDVNVDRPGVQVRKPEGYYAQLKSVSAR